MTSRSVYLKTLRLKNYLFFNEPVEIDLSVSPGTGKTIVLIGGVNGAGKTSLLNAIKHTITGLHQPRAQDLYSENPVDDELQFELDFVWGDAEYRLTRSYRKDNRFIRSSTLRRGADVEREEESIKRLIDSAFPPNLLDLFFFDVEEVKKVLTHDDAPEEIKRQIEQLLGLEMVRRSRDDAVTLANEHDTSKHRPTLSAPHIENELAQVRDSYSEVVHKIQDLQEQVYKLEQELQRTPTSAQAEALLVSLRAKEQERDELETAIVTHRDEGLRYIKEYLIYEVLEPLLRNYGAAEQAAQGTSRLDIDLDTAYRILETKQDELRRLGVPVAVAFQIVALLRGVPSEDTVPSLESVTKRVEDKLGVLRQFGNTGLDLSLRLERAVERREIVIQEIGDIRNRIGASEGDSEERRFREEYLASQKEKLGRLLEQKSSLEEKIKALELQQQEANKQASDYVRLSAIEKLAQDYVRVFTEMLDLGRRQVITRLGQVATEIFRKLDNDPKLYGEIRFDRQFHPHLLRGGEQWQATNLSQGHQTIFAYSILAALMRLSGSTLPAVIDTPMMKLDRRHKTNVVECLYPSLSHQLIIFSSEEEIDPVYYPMLKPYVTRSYVIRQRSYEGPKGPTKTSYLVPGYFVLDGGQYA